MNLVIKTKCPGAFLKRLVEIQDLKVYIANTLVGTSLIDNLMGDLQYSEALLEHIQGSDPVSTSRYISPGIL